MTRDAFTVAALLFDLDNTLFDRDRAVRCWAEAFAHARLALADDDAGARAEAVAYALALDARGYGAKPPMFAALKARYPALAASVEDLVDAFYRQVPTYATLDGGAQRLLDALERAGVPFGIVTNGSRYQLHTIQALGLDSRTPCILVSDLVGCRKPDAAIFAAAAARLGVPPGAVLFVGDNPEADVWGAHRAGMRTAWLQRDRGQAWPATIMERCADLTIGALDELVGLVGRAIGPGRTELAACRRERRCGLHGWDTAVR